MSTMAETPAVEAPHTLTPTCMESVNRIVKLPVVESTIQTATNIYGKVKEYNGVTQWTCSTAESAVHKAVDLGMPIATPIVQSLEGPIKKVDDVLCSGLNYVESRVPAVKLPPGEILQQLLNTTKDYVSSTVSTAYEKIEPAVEGAMHVIEPVVDRAKTTVVQPAMEAAQNLRDYGLHKMEEMVHELQKENSINEEPVEEDETEQQHREEHEHQQ